VNVRQLVLVSRRIGCLLVAVLGLSPAEASPLPAVPAKPDCAAVEGLPPLLAPGKVLLFGEMHGTAESPAFVADVVCLALAAGRTVTVGLEVPIEEEGRVAAYLASEGAEKDRAALLAGPFWNDVYQDGRRSRAMAALLADLRRLRRHGTLRVALLDSAAPMPGQERDRAMAGRLAAAIQANPRDVVVTLTGNLHNLVARGFPWDERYEPMGFLLAQLRPGLAITSLDVAHAGGSAWICTSAEPTSCALRPLGPHKSDGGARRVVLQEGVTKDGYNGFYNVGALTASPPAAKP